MVFGRTRKSKGLFVPTESGLLTHRRTPLQVQPFTHVPSTPAVSLTKEFREANISLAKRYDAAEGALKKYSLDGLRAEVIVLLDGSGSMATDYTNGTVQKLLERVLGFALQVDKNGVQIIVYGSTVNKPFLVTSGNYQSAAQSVKPPLSATNMADAFLMATEMVKQSDKLVIVINISDGNPYVTNYKVNGKLIDNKTATTNAVADLSQYVAIVKNLAIRPVPYFDVLDDMPSRVEYQKDENEKPLRDPNTDNLVMYYSQDPNAYRAWDNVDSQVVDPYNDSDQLFAEKMTCEVPEQLEVLFRIGMLTGTSYEVDFALTT